MQESLFLTIIDSVQQFSKWGGGGGLAKHTIWGKVGGLAGLGVHSPSQIGKLGVVFQLPEVPHRQAVVAAATHNQMFLPRGKLQAQGIVDTRNNHHRRAPPRGAEIC